MKYKNLMKIAAKSNTSILLLGESGSGKEVAARFIHEQSLRKGPFVALNCGAIARNLAESILEGARRGAFTGATDQQGVVRAAAGGTLFLDEIGEMPLETQCKLLRILQERSVLPLGETRSVPVDFRLICATNRDLKTEVATGRFREDLYFRLNVFPIRVPPLRERSDIESLAQNLWEEILKEIYPIENQTLPVGDFAPFEKLSDVEIKLIMGQRWPGNVRQLKNVLQRYALLKPHSVTLSEIISEEYDMQGAFMECTSTVNLDENSKIKSDFLPSKIPSNNPSEDYRFRRYASAPRWEIIYDELQRNNWNKCATAKQLGISRGCLDYQIKKWGAFRT